jgi:hypothetical protein
VVTGFSGNSPGTHSLGDEYSCPGSPCPELYDDDDDKDEDVALHKGVESILIVSATSPTAMR